jgi:hypothetical protein
VTTFKLEMRVGQDQRVVEADSRTEEGDWFVFYRRPATGGTVEYWRVKQADIISMETVP